MIIRAVAGIFSITGIALSVLISNTWLLLTAFVAVNLFQSAFTGFCPLEFMLKKMGRNRS